MARMSDIEEVVEYFTNYHKNSGEDAMLGVLANIALSSKNERARIQAANYYLTRMQYIGGGATSLAGRRSLIAEMMEDQKEPYAYEED